MSIGNIGKRLEKIRKQLYNSADEAVAAINKAGLDITINQLYSLESGKWPSRSQIIMLCDFFAIDIGYLLLGDESPHNQLTKEQQAIVERIVQQFVAGNKRLPPPARDN